MFPRNQSHKASQIYIRLAVFAVCLIATIVPCAAQTLSNASFDTPTVTTNTDSLRPTGATWTFVGQAGIRNNSAPNGSEGKQVAFLSAAPVSGNNNFGSVRQTVTLKPGTYYVRYLAAVKTPTGRPQPVQLYVNSVTQGGVLNPRYITDATTGGFESGCTQPFVVSVAGSYELRFDATNATNYGTTAAPLYAVAYLDAVTVVSVPTGFANAGFEVTGTWTLSSGATATAATDAPEGGKVLTMASAATASQSLALPAGRYSLSLKVGKASAAAGTLNVEVASNGDAAATVAAISATTAAEYRAYSTAGFALPQGSHVFTLRASGSSFSVDAVALNDAGPDAVNAGFETPVLAAPSSATAVGSTVANPTTATWTFSGTGGLIQANAGSSNNSAPRTIAGKQYLALSGTGAVAQSLTFAGGTYVAVGLVAQGGVKVLVDGTQVGKLSASTLDFREVMSAPFVVAAGTRSLSLAVDTTYSPATPKLDEFRLLRVDVPPAVSITAPANGAVFQTGATVDITASASDPDGISNLAISRTPTGGSATQLASSASSPLSTSWSNSSANGYTITASATDSTGATSSTAINIRVNANPSAIVSVSPTGPVVTSASAVTATVTVSSASDSDGTVTKIEFLQDAVVAATCTKTIPPAVAPFTCALSLPPRAAAYALTVRVTDNDGGATTTSPLTLRINTAPTVTLTAVCVAPCSVPGTVNLAATPTDADGTIAKVEFYDGATLLSTKTASPWTYAHTTAATGSHSYTAKAFDNNSASTSSSAQTVTVTAPVPSVALTASCTAPCNAPAAVALTAVPSNITGTISKVEFYDGVTLLTSDASSPYSFAAASVAAATHSYTAKVYVTGTTAAVATSVAQTVRVNALPTVTLAASCVAPCSAPGTVNLTATPADADGTISKVEFYDGATLLATTTASPWVYSHTTATVGTHSYTAKAFDNDNASKTSATQSVSVVALPPSATLSASCTAPCTAPATVQLAVAPSNIGGTISKVEFYDGTTLLGADTTSPYALSVASVAAATHSYSAKVYVTGNTTAVATSPAVALTVNPNNGLTVNLTVWANPVVGNNQAIDMHGGATSLPGSIVTIDFYANSVLIGSGILQGSYVNPDGSHGDYAYYTWQTTVAGTYTITAHATDTAGNVSVSPGTVVVVSPISVTVTNPTNNSNVDQPGPVMLTATAATTVGAITKIEFFRGGNVLIGTATTAPYTYSWQNMAAGQYDITAKATTSSGAALTSDSVFITVFDPTPATFTVNSPLPGFEIWAAQNYTLNGTITGPSGTTVSGTLDYSGTLSNGTVCGPCTAYPFSANASAGAFSGTFSTGYSAVGAMVLNVVATTPKGITTKKSVSGTLRFSHVNITSPQSDGSRESQTTASSITVAGEFDVFSTPIISVNGVAATISGRQFTAAGVPLAMGRNTITASLVGTSDASSTITRSAIQVANRYEPSQLPTVEITQPVVDGAYVFAGGGNTVTIRASSPGCTPVFNGDCISELDFYVDGVPVRGIREMFISSNSTYHTYTFSWTPTLGAHTLVARARDSNHLWNSSAPVSVNALSALTLTTLSPQSGGLYPLASATALSVQIKDLIGVVTSVTVRIDGANPITLMADPAFPYGYPNYERRYQTTLEQLGLTQTLGPHSITVEAMQESAVLSSQTTAFTLGAKYDGVLDGISAFQNALVGTPIALRTSGLIAGVVPTRVEYVVNGQVVLNSSAAPFVQIWKPVASGAYYLSVRAYDSAGNKFASTVAILDIADTPQVTQTLYGAPLGRSTFYGRTNVTQGSTVTVNGMLAQIDAASGQFFVNDLLFAPGDNFLDIVITDIYGRQTTRTVNVQGWAGYGSNNFRASVSPSVGQIPFDAVLTTSNPNGVSFDGVRVNCDSTRATLTTTYAATAIVDGVPFATCSFTNAGINVVKFEFLGSWGQVLEIQLRRVMARASVNDAAAALATYYSFLSSLLDQNVPNAAKSGFEQSNRADWQARLSGLTSAQLTNYATAMFNVKEFRQFGSFAELVVALPAPGNSGYESYTVRMVLDIDGFWRIESP